jgi:hypothetical protein
LELGHQRLAAHALQGLAEVARLQGEHARAQGLLIETLMTTAELGNRIGVAGCLQTLAALAAAQGSAERAARLCSAADALRTALAAPIPPAGRAEYEETVAVTRAALGDQAFASAWAAGSSMTMEQAIVFATNASST